jgi:hypothetical protein
MSLRLGIPLGYTASAKAGGRKGARRWSIYKGPEDIKNWIGDVVLWPEGQWDWQPKGGSPVMVTDPTLIPYAG